MLLFRCSAVFSSGILTTKTYQLEYKDSRKIKLLRDAREDDVNYGKKQRTREIQLERKNERRHTSSLLHVI